jgi:hypothetical protein
MGKRGGQISAFSLKHKDSPGDELKCILGMGPIEL